MHHKRFVLASNSPRRIALLRLLGYDFDIIPHQVEEDSHSNASPLDLVQTLAFLKANDVASRTANTIIIAADTIVLHNKTVLGKPKDANDARRMLSLLSDSEHAVISGICIMDASSKKKLLRTDKTYVKMKHITESEIEIYVRSGEPMDKAGAYAIQGEGGKFVERINGNFSNAVGLPLEILRETLDSFINNANT